MPRISFVVPIFRTEKYLKNCVDSLLGQDYKDFNIIAVLDGENKKCETILKKYKDKRLQYIKIKHGGVCAARNAGAEIATGDYISFFSSDFTMLPGAVLRWIEELKDNPDFIYSEYRWKRENKFLDAGMPTLDFDPRQLEVHNYIDGGFPVKREIWQKYPWDKNCKSLNDWLFWLKIVKLGGYKGKRIKDIAYVAEVPREKGLSYDSHANWLKRVKYVKEQVGIKHRDICVSSFGTPYHAQKYAEILDADFNMSTIYKPTDYKLFYLMGFYTETAPMIAAHTELARMMKGRRTKVVVHWIGGDTWQLMHKPFIDVKKIRGLIDKYVDVNLCENKRCAKELAEMGIKARIVPVSVHKERNIMPQPKSFKIAMYFPGRDRDPKDKNLMAQSYAIADKLKKMKFDFYGCPDYIGQDNHHKNVTHCGMVDFDKFGSDHALIVRLCRHDSIPMAAVDFICMGRRVITNIEDFPYMNYIDSKGLTSEELVKEVVNEIKKIKGEKISITKQKKARDYYLKIHSQKKYIRIIKGLK